MEMVTINKRIWVIGLGFIVLIMLSFTVLAPTRSQSGSYGSGAEFTVRILYPEFVSRFDKGDEIMFKAEVKGGKPPYMYRWKSSNDGIIKEENIDDKVMSFSTTELSVGIHSITIDVVDSEGKVAEYAGQMYDGYQLLITILPEDKCLTHSPGGTGVEIKKVYKTQNYEMSNELMPGGSPVENAVISALTEGVNNHPEWNVGSIDELNSEQRMQAIFEWIKRNMGYHCDFDDESCQDSCPQCRGKDPLCKCIDGYSCHKNKGDVTLSADEILTKTSECCESGGYRYFGDCDDHAVLYAAMARKAGISENCIALTTSKIDGGGHAYNSATIRSEEGYSWEYIDTTKKYLDWEDMIAISRYYYFTQCGIGGEHNGFNDWKYNDTCGE